MIFKLEMSLDECLEQYQTLSKQIFAKQRSLFRRIFGSDISKYSAQRLQTAIEGLLARRGYRSDLSLQDPEQKGRIQG